MNPEPNLKHEQPAPVLTDIPSAAMASPSSSSSTSSIGSKSSKGSLGGAKKDEEPRAGAGDDDKDLSTPALIGKVPPAVAAAVSSYVLPKAKKVRRSAKKKGGDGSDKPRRPLSAYNYFFKENRAILLAERDEKLKAAKENGEGTEGIESGYGFFGTMAKVIAQRWKVITPDSLEVYKKKAEIDSKRYREEMEEYNTRKRLAPKALDESKKGKKAKVKAGKKDKLPKGAEMAAAAAKYGKTPVLIEDARALAGAYPAPPDFAMQSQAMARFGAPQQGNSGLDYSSMGLGGAGMGMLPRSANQFAGMGQADLEAQLALLQQQRQLEAMGLYSQATRPALLGIPSHQLSQQMMGGGGSAGGGGGMQPQFMFEQMGFPNTMNLFGAGQAPMSDLSFSSRMDNYAQQQQQLQQQQQQQEQESAMLRQQQQMMLMNAQQDPGYANLLLQLRLQEQEDRLRNQAALNMGQGRW